MTPSERWSDGRSERVRRRLQARTDLGEFPCCEIYAFLLYFGSFSLLVSALLLILSALVEPAHSRLDLRDRPRKLGQLTSDEGYVRLGCHFAQKSICRPARSNGSGW